jgi:hypothetical protein
MQIPLPIFSQRDPRWKDKKLGISSNSIGGYGCLDTCLAMVAKYYGKDTDPDRLNSALIKLTNDTKEAWGYKDGDLYIWKSVTQIYSDITETKQVLTPNPVSSTQFNSIKAEIDAGRPVIIEVDFIPATSGIDMHFVVIIGYTDNGDGTVTWIVADPWYGDVSNLTRYCKDGLAKNQAYTIQRFVFTFGPIPTPAVDKPNDDQVRALSVINSGYNDLPADDNKPGNLESYARRMIDEDKAFPQADNKAKQFDAFIEKWFREWTLAEDTNGNKSHQIILEEEMGKFLGFEDKSTEYRGAIESLVGHFDDDPALLKALEAFKDELDGLRGKLEDCQKAQLPKGYLVKSVTFRWFNKKDYTINIYDPSLAPKDTSNDS